MDCLRMDVRSPAQPEGASAVERVARAIEQAGFRPLLIQAPDADAGRRSGFVLRACPDGRVELRWVGLRDLTSWPWRRALLTGYAGVLRQAGFAVQYVADDDEAYLVCALPQQDRGNESVRTA
jgi:hypothetical protein